jgi:hypothetical protein
MGSHEHPEPGAYVRLLADQARLLQREARSALERGEYARASALIGDAELLAEDVHDLVGDIEHREMSGLMTLAAYDVRAAAEPARKRFRVPLPSRRLRMALGTSIAMSLSLTEC